MMKLCSAAAMAVALCGCASITRGTSEMVEVRALPADAAIRTSLGDTCTVGPCKVKVSRKTEFTAFAEKAGYRPGSLQIKTQVGGGGAAGLAGNILVGGIIGVGVDAATGASLDHYPNPATIVLVPVDPTNPATPTFEAPPPPPRQKATEQRVARK